MSESEVKASFIMSRSIFGRFIYYVFIYLLILFAWSFVVLNLHISIGAILGNLLLFIPPAIIPYWIEKSNRAWRRENGFNISKAIKLKDLEQMEVDERVAMEKKAYENVGIKQGIDKNDIGYWFDLKEKGAITEEEFLAKKEELLI